jgi:uncharacterized protein
MRNQREVILMDKQQEQRQIDIDSVEVREVGDNQFLIEGYIAKFNTRSKFMGFYEEIRNGAFDKTLADGHNIFALYAHDKTKILGSTQSNKLSLSVDAVGLKFELRINPEISHAKDAFHLVKDGDVQGCSFGFIAQNDEWRMLEDGTEIRYLNEVHLTECTITPTPAYEATEVSCRSYETFKAEEEKRAADKVKRKKMLLLSYLQ